jgi:segregation and condensation protein A
MLDLYNLFNELMFIYISKINVENKIPKEISLDKFKIEDKMEELYKYIVNNKRLEFSNVIKKSSSKMEAIVTFLAMLEMIKLRTINIYQEGNFNEIYIEGIDKDE